MPGAKLALVRHPRQTPVMSGIARELDETLQRIDPSAAERVTHLVREILLLAETQGVPNKPVRNELAKATRLLDLATHAEPMGTLTNAEIDEAIYGQ